MLCLTEKIDNILLEGCVLVASGLFGTNRQAINHRPSALAASIFFFPLPSGNLLRATCWQAFNGLFLPVGGELSVTDNILVNTPVALIMLSDSFT